MRRLLLFGTALCLAACVRYYPHELASQEVASNVKAGIVAPELARIVAFKGQILSTSPLDFWTPGLPGAGDLIVNGVDVGGVNRDQAIAVDVQLGAYVVSWKDVGDTNEVSSPLNLTLAPGQIVYLSMDRMFKEGSGPAAGLAAGAAGPVGVVVAGVGAAASASESKQYYDLLRLHSDGAALIQADEITAAAPVP